ncbi:MAG: type II secretion system F family protein [Vulcanimicrobiota bacterium]
MPEFVYSARDADDNRHRGRLEAPDRQQAEAMLKQQYANVVQLDEVVSPDNIQRFLNWITPVKGDDLLGFSQALASMLEGGISMKRVMDILYEDIEHPALRRVVSDLSNDIAGGQTLSQALTKHPEVFDDFYRSMVKAGERSGNLPEMLRRLADYTEKTEGIKEKVKAALTYPTLLIIFSFFLITGLMGISVPFLQEIYGGLGLQIHWATNLVVVVGGLLGSNIYILIPLVIALLYFVARFFSGEKGQTVLDSIRLRLPVVSELYRLLYTARFSRTLATLYASGIAVLDSLELASDTVGNRVVGNEILSITGRVKSGEQLSTCLRDSPHFTRLAIGMIAAGEESGDIDRMLHKVADVYELKVYNALEGFASTIQPIIMVVVGLAVALIIIVMGLPFLQMTGLS